MDILVTCPPMIGMKHQFLPIMENLGLTAHCPDIVQTLSEDKLISMLPEFDGWIIGDDPATWRVFEAGKAGKLKAAVKWGVGVDNVDFEACASLGIPIENTPGMFGNEVADIAVGYLIALARDTFLIDREIRAGKWPKPRGISLEGKTVGLIGYGDVGRHAAVKFGALGLEVIAYVSNTTALDDRSINFESWPRRIEDCDFLVFACSLNSNNYHMLGTEALARTKRGVRIVNVARGALIDEVALVQALSTGQVHAVALDVYEDEPLQKDSHIRFHERCILGSHNASNTEEAVARTNILAIEKLKTLLQREGS